MSNALHRSPSQSSRHSPFKRSLLSSISSTLKVHSLRTTSDSDSASTMARLTHAITPILLHPISSVIATLAVLILLLVFMTPVMQLSYLLLLGMSYLVFGPRPKRNGHVWDRHKDWRASKHVAKAISQSSKLQKLFEFNYNVVVYGNSGGKKASRSHNAQVSAAADQSPPPSLRTSTTDHHILQTPHASISSLAPCMSESPSGSFALNEGLGSESHVIRSLIILSYQLKRSRRQDEEDAHLEQVSPRQRVPTKHNFSSYSRVIPHLVSAPFIEILLRRSKEAKDFIRRHLFQAPEFLEHAFLYADHNYHSTRNIKTVYSQPPSLTQAEILQKSSSDFSASLRSRTSRDLFPSPESPLASSPLSKTSFPYSPSDGYYTSHDGSSSYSAVLPTVTFAGDESQQFAFWLPIARLVLCGVGGILEFRRDWLLRVLSIQRKQHKGEHKHQLHDEQSVTRITQSQPMAASATVSSVSSSVSSSPQSSALSGPSSHDAANSANRCRPFNPFHVEKELANKSNEESQAIKLYPSAFTPTVVIMQKPIIIEKSTSAAAPIAINLKKGVFAAAIKAGATIVPIILDSEAESDEEKEDTDNTGNKTNQRVVGHKSRSSKPRVTIGVPIHSNATEVPRPEDVRRVTNAVSDSLISALRKAERHMISSSSAASATTAPFAAGDQPQRKIDITYS